MIITVHCDGCRRAFQLDEKFVGQEVRCKSCGNNFVVTRSDDPQVDPLAAASFRPPPQAPSDDSAKWRGASVVPDEMRPPRGEYRTSAPTLSPQLLTAALTTSNGPLELSKFVRRSSGHDAMLEGWSRFITVMFGVASALAGLYATLHVYMHADRTAPPNVFTAQVWVALFCANVLLFVFIGPAVALGLWLSAAMLESRVIERTFTRIYAVAAIFTAVLYFALAVGGVPRILLLIALALLMAYVLRAFFDLDWLTLAVTFVAVALCWFGAAFLSGLLLGVIIPDGIVSIVAGPPRQAAPSAVESPQTLPEASGLDSAFLTFNARAEAQTSADLTEATREQILPSAIELQHQVNLMRPMYGSDPAYLEMARRVGLFLNKAQSLPSGVLDGAIFQDPPDAEDWTIASMSRGRLAPELSIHSLKFQPPLDLRLNLDSSLDSPEGLIWNGAVDRQCELTVSTRPRLNPAQRRPLVTQAPALLKICRDENLLATPASNVIVTYGLINGLSATRLEANSGPPAGRVRMYVVPAGEVWVFVHITPPQGDPQLARIMDVSARTLRPMEEGEAPVDPFSAPFIASRLGDAYDRVYPMLQKQGPAGEAAIAAHLRSSDTLLRRRCIEALRDLGTSRSLAALRVAAHDPDRDVAEGAQSLLDRLSRDASAASIDPSHPAASTDQGYDAQLLRLIQGLTSSDPAARHGSVRDLAQIAPDDKQQTKVTTLLVNLLCKRDDATPADDIAEALRVWATPEQAPDIAVLVSDSSPTEVRQIAMKVLGSIKATLAAPTIVKYLDGDADAASSALIAMGHGAEDAVAPRLADPKSAVRMAAANILAKIGTTRSIASLYRASRDAGADAPSRQAALHALEAVRLRMAESQQ